MAQARVLSQLDVHLALLAMDEIPGASFLVFDLDLRYVVARGSALTKNGYSSDDLEGRLAYEALTPQRWQVYEISYRDALVGRSTVQQVVSPDRRSHYLVRISPLRDTEGDIIGGVVISTEVTESVVAHEALALSEHQYRLLAENASDVVFQTNVVGEIIWVSPSVHRVLGWDPVEMLGTKTPVFIHPDDLEATLTRRAAVFAGGSVTNYSTRFRCSSGDYRWVSVTARALRDPEGQVTGVVAGLRDVHEETLAREALAASEQLFRTAMDSSLVGMALVELDGRFRVANPALCRLVGRDRTWMSAHSADDIIHPEDLPSVLRDRKELIEGRRESITTLMRLVRSDGVILRARRSGAAIRRPDGGCDCLVMQWEDLTAEYEIAEKLQYQAFHDPLTGLRNRAWILDALEADLRSSQRTGGSVAVLFLDLDDFKLVNDSLGHVAGDAVLREVACRIQGCLRPTDLVGRFGGDEFIAVINRVRSRAELESVADRIVAAAGVSLQVGEHSISPSVSIGIAVSDDKATSRTLLRDADAALYRAKADGRDCWRFFEESLHVAAMRRLVEREEIRAALDAREFEPHYQPIVSLPDRRVVAHEALVRWNHPTLGTVPAHEFMATARESGLVVAIGWQVIESVLRGLAYHPELLGAVHINVGAEQLNRRDWIEDFLALLSRWEVGRSRISLEVAEDVLVGLSAETRAGLAELAEQGVGLVIEGFGSGLTSIPLLRALPVTGIKLDPGFVADLASSGSPASALASGIAGLASGLGLLGIVEGVETEEQATVLAIQGWAWGQGWLFGGPVSLSEMLRQGVL